MFFEIFSFIIDVYLLEFLFLIIISCLIMSSCLSENSQLHGFAGLFGGFIVVVWVLMLAIMYDRIKSECVRSVELGEVKTCKDFLDKSRNDNWFSKQLQKRRERLEFEEKERKEELKYKKEAEAMSRSKEEYRKAAEEAMVY